MRHIVHECHVINKRLVPCCMLDGTNKSDGCWVRARRTPQRYPQVSRGFATPPWRKRRGFMFQIACNTALTNTVQLSPCPWFVILDLIREPWIAVRPAMTSQGFGHSDIPIQGE
ncbi:hypothetical protein Bpro_0914 [Polaromonas sp. JS666]|nr:hypothetical protein Bpro_0914 [Polaromonas sp. JS666]